MYKMPRRKLRTATSSLPSSPFSFLSLFGFHHVTNCDNDDDDFYCSFMRVFQLIIAFIILAVILYLVYVFVLMPLIMSNNTKRG